MDSYTINIKQRNKLRFLIGLVPRFRLFLYYSLIRQIAKKRGATIGRNSIISLSLAMKCNENLHIGDNTIIHTNLFSSFRYPIYIGNNVIIGNGVKIVMGSHNIDSTLWEHRRPNDSLIIEDYVWLAPDSVILPSCSNIKYGTVLGANSVLTKNTSELDILGGNPAKIIKKRKCVHSDLIVESMLGGDFLSYIKARYCQ